MVTTETKRFAAIIVSFGGSGPLERWTQRMVALLERYASARECEVSIVA
jgi:hypothetical protein